MVDSSALLEWALGSGVWLLYSALLAGSAVENVIPPVPADTFVILGGVLAGQGHLNAGGVFLFSWLGNVGSALGVFLLGKRYGASFFAGRLGSWLLSPSQLMHMERFFRRWGVIALVGARLLPGIRAVVPAFAGVAGLRNRVVVPVLALTAAFWHLGLTALGKAAGTNLDALLALLQRTNRLLLGLSAAIVLVLWVWWRRTRGGDSGEPEDVDPTPGPEST